MATQCRHSDFKRTAQPGAGAVFLAESCRRVHMLVRSAGLAESMSHYLIRRIETASNIGVYTRTQLVALEGSDRLERVSWERGDGQLEMRELRHVFLMTGAQPNTQWLQDCVALDDHGFVKTGPDLRESELADARWSLPRPPYLIETSVRAVFAAAMCAPRVSSALLLPWAKGRSASSSYIRRFASPPTPGTCMRSHHRQRKSR